MRTEHESFDLEASAGDLAVWVLGTACPHGQSTEINCTLAKAASIAGNVTDFDGSPIPNIIVQAEPVERTPGLAATTLTSTTNGTAGYRFLNLRPGEYKVRIHIPGATPEYHDAVKGYSEMVLEDPAISGENAELIKRIHDAATRMVEMVQNLLDANRIERGEMQLNLAPTDLGLALHSVVETQRPRATGKQQTIYPESDAGPVVVQLDPGVTVQVLENLISNAVKYSPPGQEIFVRLKKPAQGARVEVQDQSPGLSAEDQRKLYGKFARLSAKPTGGGEHSTGLGLSIVKKMVEAMSGKVWCESEAGNGATFIVEFPTG